MGYPKVIQGGMGIGVSSWRLAKSVSEEGQLGVVSGTGIDTVMIRILQEGDPGGHIRRAFLSYPDQAFTQKIIKKYYNIKLGQPSFKLTKMPNAKPSLEQQGLLCLANFVEVFLAKEGHDYEVGINFLEKMQLITLPSLYGALLAGVDYVIIGAGIPREIPGVLDLLSENQDVSIKLDVAGSDSSDSFTSSFSPSKLLPMVKINLKRPRFLAIISSNILAITLKKKSNSQIDGFVVENWKAGGHNAPPRGEMQLSETGEPIYTKKDDVNLVALKKLGLPFWLAGGYSSSEALDTALEQGAEGIQVGTVFSLCNESGVKASLKENILKELLIKDLKIKTDAFASPTGFPFKVLEPEGELSKGTNNSARKRVCDLGYLRKMYKKDDGSIGYRCPGEPEDLYLKKGGNIEDCKGRRCLCNGLVANLGLAQVQKNGHIEEPLITLGDDTGCIKNFISESKLEYSAKEVLKFLLP